MRILVTGATGFIGRALVPHLLSREDTHVSLLLRENALRPFPFSWASGESQPRIEYVNADLRNFRLTARAVRQANPDRVLHLAAAGVTDPFLSIDTAIRHNVYGTVNLFRACFETSSAVAQLIVCRTPGELSAMNVYAASKAAAWDFCQMACRTRGWPIHGAMIYQVYGPGQPGHTLVPSALAAAAAGQDFPMTAGTQQRDWIFVDDVVGGLASLLDTNLEPGRTVDLGTGRLTSIKEVVHRIYSLVGRGGQPLVGALPKRPGEDSIQRANVAETKALTGWQATMSLEMGLSRLLET